MAGGTRLARVAAEILLRAGPELSCCPQAVLEVFVDLLMALSALFSFEAAANSMRAPSPSPPKGL